jgi:hypothetical protein
MSVTFVGVTATATGICVTVAVPCLLGSAAAVATTDTVAEAGMGDGAVYMPFASMLPQAAPEQPVPDRLQLTAVLEVPETVAVNCCF